MNAINERNARQTRRIELVETNNIAIAPRRLNGAKPYNAKRKRRALYHALLMGESGFGDAEISAIHAALHLP